MQAILIILGLLILISTFLDFFHTTLSGNGFGPISAAVNNALGGLIIKNRSKIIFRYSGLIHVILTTALWFFLLLVGIYLIFISGENMVVHNDTNLPASYIDRFYYMCFVVSTLGNGDFVPGNYLNRIFTGIFSFSGFVLFTTALTYFLSVVNAVLQKKQLALYISSMGANVMELYLFLAPKDNLDLLIDNSRQLKNMIIKASSDYIFFPVIQYFLTDKKRASAELQLARLNEVLLVVQKDFQEETFNYKRISSLRKSISYYLEMGLANQEDHKLDWQKLNDLRSIWKECKPKDLQEPHRDESMNAAIKGAGWDWTDVYEM